MRPSPHALMMKHAAAAAVVLLAASSALATEPTTRENAGWENFSGIGFYPEDWKQPPPLDVVCDINRGDDKAQFPWVASIRVSQALPHKQIVLAWARNHGKAVWNPNRACEIEGGLNSYTKDKMVIRRADENGEAKFRHSVLDCDTFIYQALIEPGSRDCVTSNTAGGIADLAHTNNWGMWVQPTISYLRKVFYRGADEEHPDESTFQNFGVIRNVQNWLIVGAAGSENCSGYGWKNNKYEHHVENKNPAPYLNKALTVPFKWEFNLHLVDECQGAYWRFINKSPPLPSDWTASSCEGSEMQPYIIEDDQDYEIFPARGWKKGYRQLQLNSGCQGPNLEFTTSQDDGFTTYAESDYAGEDYIRDRAKASSQRMFELGASGFNEKELEIALKWAKKTSSNPDEDGFIERAMENPNQASNDLSQGMAGNNDGSWKPAGMNSYAYWNRMGHLHFSLHAGTDWATMTRSSLNPSEIIVPESHREFKVPNPFHAGDVIYLYHFGWGKWNGAVHALGLPDDAETGGVTLEQMFFNTDTDFLKSVDYRLNGPEGLGFSFDENGDPIPGTGHNADWSYYSYEDFDYDGDYTYDNWGTLYSDMYLWNIEPGSTRKVDQPVSEKPDNALMYDNNNEWDPVTINGQYLGPKTTTGTLSKKIGTFTLHDAGHDLKHSEHPELLHQADGKPWPVKSEDWHKLKPKLGGEHFHQKYGK